jgi:hypothetical protein
MENEYRNSIVGNFVTKIFGTSQSTKDMNEIIDIANQPAIINPMIYLIPISAIIILIIVLVVVKK